MLNIWISLLIVYVCMYSMYIVYCIVCFVCMNTPDLILILYSVKFKPWRTQQIKANLTIFYILLQIYVLTFFRHKFANFFLVNIYSAPQFTPPELSAICNIAMYINTKKLFAYMYNRNCLHFNWEPFNYIVCILNQSTHHGCVTGQHPQCWYYLLVQNTTTATICYRWNSLHY